MFSWQSVLPSLAVGCSLLVLLLLGARLLTSYDLGYHLAFGESFFSTGKIVDYTPYIYTLPAPDTPVASRPEAGPGSWYDNQGRYRFTNSSWLSQLFMFGAWHLGGATGLNLLQLIIIAGIFILMLWAMKKSRIPGYLISFGLLLTGLIINSRMNMRPELFGYLCIMAQYLLLARPAIQTDRPEPPSWSWVGGMIFVQVLCINFHSYFLLGLAITGTVFVEYLLRALKKRFGDKDMPGFQAYWKVVSRLGITLGGMVLACFLNPWGWRLVLQPLQTLLYMKKYNIGGPKPGVNSHPWDNIIELRGTIAEHWPIRLSDYAVLVMLILVAVVVIFQMLAWLAKIQREKSMKKSAASHHAPFTIRWAHLFMISGMLFVGLQLRRNIGVGSLIVVPSALVCITESCRYLLAEKLQQSSRKLLILANAAILVLTLYGGYQIFTGKIFAADALPTRFGFGLSNTVLPIGASDWLNKYAPEARVWTDFQNSSTLHFFTQPHKEVPLLTNTWAYPPDIMAEDIFYCRAIVPFTQLADKYNVDAVVLRTDWTRPLHRQLGADPEWKIVQVEGVNVLYMRANEKYGALAEKHEIRPDNFAIDSFIRGEISKDPSFKRAILDVSDTFNDAGELDLAINIIEGGLKYLRPDVYVWQKLYALYGARESLRREKKDKRVIDDIRRMQYVLRKIIELQPDNMAAITELDKINRVLSVIGNVPGQ